MQLLNRQIAVVNFEPLRAHFMAVYTGTQASLPGLNAMPSLRSYMQRNAMDKNPEKVLFQRTIVQVFFFFFFLLSSHL